MSDTEDIGSLNIPVPGSGRQSDFTQPVRVTLDDLHNAHFYFSWAQQTVGFGQCSISRDPATGQVSADTEGMGKEWLRRALYAAVDTLVENAKLD